MNAEERAERSIRYLFNTDALSSSDYVPEIRAEFIRVWNDAIAAHEKALEAEGLVDVPKQRRDFSETQSAFSVMRERFFGKQ